jgi:hypothetical protein
MSDALEDWLAHGVDGLSARTVTSYRGTIVKALREELGGVRLTELTASDVQRALTALASRSSTRTIQIAHNVLVRAIRHAERDDLVGRNVASLVDAPKGQQSGRPSKSLTLEQTVALMAAAKGTASEAYIVVSLLSGCGPRRRGRCGGITWWLGLASSTSRPGRQLRRHLLCVPSRPPNARTLRAGICGLRRLGVPAVMESSAVRAAGKGSFRGRHR